MKKCITDLNANKVLANRPLVTLSQDYGKETNDAKCGISYNTF